jgi:hypothetical protein
VVNSRYSLSPEIGGGGGGGGALLPVVLELDGAPVVGAEDDDGDEELVAVLVPLAGASPEAVAVAVLDELAALDLPAPESAITIPDGK